MCGITASIGSTKVAKVILDGLRILQNRGYDSAGICTVSPKPGGELINRKRASDGDINALKYLRDIIDDYDQHTVGIGHTRWATHGRKTDENAHPHTDERGRVAVVHNGIIENYSRLRSELVGKGYGFSSETDTEVIAVMISYYLDNGCPDPSDALNSALGRLEGTWGIAVIFAGHSDKLFLAKNGSPLLLAFDYQFAICASESSALRNHSQQYIVLDDHDVVEIRQGVDKLEMYYASDYVSDPMGYFSPGNVRKIECEKILESPAPYNHWMEREIMEQSVSIQRAMNNGGRIYSDREVKLGGLNESSAELLNIDHLIILGCGTSYHSGLVGAKYFRQLRAFKTVQVFDASEFTIHDLPQNVEIGVLLLSQSGETKDVHRAMEMIREHNVTIFSIVNVVGSMIAREADCGMYLNAGREVAVASTKSFTSQVTALVLFSIWFAQKRDSAIQKRTKLIRELRGIHHIYSTLLPSLPKLCDDVIPHLINASSIFVLGRDMAEPIAYEGALKIKEVSYIHAEGYSGGSLKHGPFALIVEDTPIIFIVHDDQHASKMHIAAAEVRSRGAFTIIITNIADYSEAEELYNYHIRLPTTSPLLAPLLSILPLQYIAYKLSISREINPDFPRNLAKVVTVDG